MAENPKLITYPFANEDTTKTTDFQAEPTTLDPDTLVTQKYGWKQVYSTPLDAGGAAPERDDMNGLFNWITTLLYRAQKGWVWKYDANQQYLSPALVWDIDGNKQAKDPNYKGEIYLCKQDVEVGSTYHRPSTDITYDFWIPLTEYLRQNIPVNNGKLEIYKNDTKIAPKTESGVVSESDYSANTNQNLKFTVPVGNGVLKIKYGDTTWTFSADQTTGQDVDIPVANNGKLTINTEVNTNGSLSTTKAGEFTANQSGDSTTTVKVGNGRWYAIKREYSGYDGTTVSDTYIQSNGGGQFSYSANQTTDATAVIPMGNGKTTLQLNGSNVGSWSANQNKDQTINISNAVGNGTITLKYAGQTLGSFTANQATNAEFDLLVLCGAAQPIGAVTAWAGTSTTPPPGWLFCDGSEYNRYTSKYKQLFDVIGFTYGRSGDNFKVPNLQEKFIQGASSTNSSYAVGVTKEASVPNIKGYFDAQTPLANNFGYMITGQDLGGNTPRANTWNGPFYRYQVYTEYPEFNNRSYYSQVDTGNSGGGYNNGLKFDASHVSNVYKDGITTVQPPSLCMRYIIRYI